MPFEVSNIIVKLRLESSIKILFMNFETFAEYWKRARFTNTLVGIFRSRDQEKKIVDILRLRVHMEAKIIIRGNDMIADSDS